MESPATKYSSSPHRSNGESHSLLHPNGAATSHEHDDGATEAAVEDRAASGPPPRILVAMDRSEVADATWEYLEDLGCQCEYANDLTDVTRLLDSGLDGAVLGLEIGGVSTRDLLQRLPEDKLPSGRVLCHLAKTDGSLEDLFGAVHLGVQDVMIGAMDPAKVCRLIDVIRGDKHPANGHPPADDHHSSQGNGHARKNGHASTNGNGHGTNGVAAHVVDPQEAQCERLQQTLIGESAAMASIRRTIVEVAKTRATVMICGESGTGKEVVASAIHSLSRDARGPFVPVNMAAIPEGLAESLLFGHERGAFTSANKRQVGYCETANGGTLFMDEISEMELQIQPKLLRFLQTGMVHPIGSQKTRSVSTRIITATNCDPAMLVKTGRLREDLYFRLHVVPINIPPLRDRNGDIEQLAHEFLKRFAGLHERDVRDFSDEALDVLRAYHWPGNVRQLENIVERIVIFAKGSMVMACDVPAEIHAGTSPIDSLGSNPTQAAGSGYGEVHTNGHDAPRLKPIQQRERTAIIEALQQTEGHVVDAAELLGVSQATMYRKIKEYQISRERKRRKRSPK